MKKTAVLGMYLAFAMILSYIEVLIPLPIPIPGIKLGLANLAIILILYLYGFKEALLINVVRIILTQNSCHFISVHLYKGCCHLNLCHTCSSISLLILIIT